MINPPDPAAPLDIIRRRVTLPAAEYLWGARRNLDGERGEARQVQFVVIFRF